MTTWSFPPLHNQTYPNHSLLLYLIWNFHRLCFRFENLIFVNLNPCVKYIFIIWQLRVSLLSKPVSIWMRNPLFFSKENVLKSDSATYVLASFRFSRLNWIRIHVAQPNSTLIDFSNLKQPSLHVSHLPQCVYHIANITLQNLIIMKTVWAASIRWKIVFHFYCIVVARVAEPNASKNGFSN